MVPYVTVFSSYVANGAFGVSRHIMHCNFLSSGATSICRNIFTMSAQTTNRYDRKRSNKEKMSDCKFGPFNRCWFSDGADADPADASKTTLILPVLKTG